MCAQFSPEILPAGAVKGLIPKKEISLSAFEKHFNKNM